MQCGPFRLSRVTEIVHCPSRRPRSAQHLAVCYERRPAFLSLAGADSLSDWPPPAFAVSAWRARAQPRARPDDLRCVRVSLIARTDATGLKAQPRMRPAWEQIARVHQSTLPRANTIGVAPIARVACQVRCAGDLTIDELRIVSPRHDDVPVRRGENLVRAGYRVALPARPVLCRSS